MSQRFPEVQGGGSLIIAWQVKDKNVLVVGGGEVCAIGQFNVIFLGKLCLRIWC